MDNELLVVAKAISDRRKELNYSQTKVAEMVGTTQQHIANFEAGKANLTVKIILAILEALDLEIEFNER